MDLERKLSDVLTAHKTQSDDLDQHKRACLDLLHSAKVFTMTSEVSMYIYLSILEDLCMRMGHLSEICLSAGSPRDSLGEKRTGFQKDRGASAKV